MRRRRHDMELEVCYVPPSCAANTREEEHSCASVLYLDRVARTREDVPWDVESRWEMTWGNGCSSFPLGVLVYKRQPADQKRMGVRGNAIRAFTVAPVAQLRLYSGAQGLCESGVFRRRKD